jgi:hypothetical protein
LGTGLLPLGRSPIQKIVVMIPRFHEYRPGPPLSAASLPIKEGPVMYRGPSPGNTVFVGDMITLGSIFSKAFLRSFIAYLA